MKMKILSTAALLVLLSFSVGWAQSGEITLDHTDGLYDGTRINTDDSVRFYIRLNNTSSGSITGYTNAFQIYSGDGAVWNPKDTLLGVNLGTITTAMIGNQFVNSFSADGIGADTVGFGGFRIFEPGILSGFNEVTWMIEIGTFDASNHGKTICIDSSFNPPASTWKWSTTAGDQFPTWDGPHCWTIYDSTQA
ncbi:MAG: hypothetical protein P1R58_12575, partial [bacterium]|nr:hypothetical protein [bacterium]